VSEKRSPIIFDDWKKFDFFLRLEKVW
jgi:hypothetical protein